MYSDHQCILTSAGSELKSSQYVLLIASRQMFPGFGIATVAFGLYLFYDNLITSKQPHHASEDTQGQHGIAT
jgi:hypothetical protein